jgi:hypothetical protein
MNITYFLQGRTSKPKRSGIYHLSAVFNNHVATTRTGIVTLLIIFRVSLNNDLIHESMCDEVKTTISYPCALISSAISETRLSVLNLYDILFLLPVSFHFLIVSSIASTNRPCTFRCSFRFRES